MARKTVRVLLTDGEKTVKLAWVKHTGDELYLGPAFAFKQGGLPRDIHFSYHSSGCRTAPTNSLVAPLSPMARITGHVVVLTMWIRSGAINDEYGRPFRGQKSEDDFLIDVRTIPQSGANILIGLLEPGREEALQRHPDFEVRQSSIVRNVSPWLVISLQCRRDATGEPAYSAGN